MTCCKLTCICFCGCVACVVVGSSLSRVPRAWLLATDVIIYSIYKTMYVQNRKTWRKNREKNNNKIDVLYDSLVKNTALMYDSEYRWRHTVSSISCKTISPSVVLNSPVKFSHPKWDCPVSAYKLLVSHTKTSDAHVLSCIICFTVLKPTITARWRKFVSKKGNWRRQQKVWVSTERKQASFLTLERTVTDCCSPNVQIAIIMMSSHVMTATEYNNGERRILI